MAISKFFFGGLMLSAILFAGQVGGAQEDFPEQITAIALDSEISPDCRWSGPSPEKLLAMQLPPGRISDALGSEVIPFLQRNGIPVSFVSGVVDDPNVSLEISASTVLREALDEIVRQAPGYQYAVVDSRLLVYPRSAVYDAPVDLTPLEGALRASAVYAVLRELRAKSAPFQKLGWTLQPHRAQIYSSKMPHAQNPRPIPLAGPDHDVGAAG